MDLGIKKQHVYISIIVLLVLALRLFIVFQTPFFNYEAYFDLRQIESIKETGLPAYQDEFSYGGKTQLFPPAHHYLLAFFSLFIPLDIVAKVLPNIFAALIVIVVYLLAIKLTKGQKISLTTAFMSGFIPVAFLDINRISVDYLTVLMVLLIFYCFFRINERKYVDYALIIIFLLVITTPLALIIIPGLLIYLLFLKLEKLQIEMKELEIIVFFSFLAFWVNLLIYKNAFLKHGVLIIWQNMPVTVLSEFFSRLTFFEAILTISLIPLLLGLYSIYITFYGEKSKESLLLIGFAASTFILIWFKLLNLVTGLIFLSMTLVVLSSIGLKDLSNILGKSHFHMFAKILLGVLILLFVMTAIIPSYIFGLGRVVEVPNKDDIVVLEWAAQNIPKDSTIAAPVKEGNLVTYYAKRKNIIDTNYLLTSNIDKRYNDVETIYKTKFVTEAVSLLNEYEARYVLLSSKTLEEYGTDTLSYAKEQECFNEVFHIRNSTVYSSKCKIK